MKLKSPFPYMGGKSKVAALIWSRLGDVRNYIEPFCGSAAVLLLRPHAPKIETINDLDCYITNFWRATAADPEAVVAYCDWPVDECDLHARHQWLVFSEDAIAFRQLMLMGGPALGAPGWARKRKNRDARIYGHDSATVAAEARQYCIERGDDTMLRIALCGLEGEHEELERHGWSVVAWSAQGGYGNRSANDNKHRERIWFSPHCLPAPEGSAV